MSVELNHTIVWCRDRDVSAAFLTDILGLPAARPFGPFAVVEVANGVSLDFHVVEDGPTIASQHYCFLVSEKEFDEIFKRVTERRLDYWADPACSREGQISQNDGGRGFYFHDPDGHFLEVITRPYGSGEV